MKHLIAMVICCVGLVVALPVIASESAIRDVPDYGETVFTETFDDNSRDWETFTDSRYISIIADGSYFMSSRMGTSFNPSFAVGWWVVAPGFTDWSLSPIFDTSYEVEIEVSDVQSTSEHYGVSVIFFSQQDYTQYLLYTAYDTGEYLLHDKQSTVWQPGEMTITPNFLDGETHTIGVRVDSSGYTLIIDRLHVAHEAPIDGMNPGTVGFGVVSYFDEADVTVTAQFDNLVVRTP